MAKKEYKYSAPLSNDNTVYLNFSSKPKWEDIEKIKKWLAIFEDNLIREETDNQDREEHF